jgi:hypothetical protein
VADPATEEFIATHGKEWGAKMVAEAVEYVKSKKTQ